MGSNFLILKNEKIMYKLIKAKKKDRLRILSVCYLCDAYTNDSHCGKLFNYCKGNKHYFKLVNK